jgi:hypothetical protein
MVRKMTVFAATCWAVMAGAQSNPSDAALTELLASTSEQMTLALGYMNAQYDGLGGAPARGFYGGMDILSQLSLSDGRAEVARICRAQMESQDKYLRYTAAMFLRDIAGDEAVAPFVLQMYKEATPDDVYVVALFASSVAPSDEEENTATTDLLAAVAADLRSDDAAARMKAAHFIALVPAPQTLPLMLEALTNADPQVRRLTAGALSRYYVGEEDAAATRDKLKAALKDADAGVREAAVMTLGETGDAAVADDVMALCRDAEPAVRRAAAIGLYTIYGSQRPADAKKTRAQLLKYLKTENDAVARTYLAAAYGYAYADAAAPDTYRELSPNGYWAFFSGSWKEKELDSYYNETGTAGGGG